MVTNTARPSAKDRGDYNTLRLSLACSVITELLRTLHQLLMIFFNTAKEQVFKPAYSKPVCLQQRLHMIPLSGDGMSVRIVGMPSCGALFQIYLRTALNWFRCFAAGIPCCSYSILSLGTGTVARLFILQHRAYAQYAALVGVTCTAHGFQSWYSTRSQQQPQFM